MTWSSGKENALPGIEQGTIYHFGTAFVVWSDARGGGGGISSSNVQGVKCQGSLAARDGRRVEFHCETKDAKTGQVKINGEAYELADGNLFLVFTEGEQSRVKQLKRDISNLKFERESLEAFGRNDPEIAEFFTKGAKAK
ncbi:MAG: hypothetical protein HYS12_16490 [Planctomycetes bacterium]|nr:hypothetical protein [Planctomycetota bacterium]